MNQITEIAGIVEKILFSNKENGYTILILDLGKGKNETIVCNQAGIDLFNYVTFKGEYKENKKFGKQFVASSFVISHPKDNNQLESYLINFKGIGFVLAKRLIDFYGDNTLDVLNTNIESILEVKGFTEKIVAQLKEDWNQDKNSHIIIMELQKFGVPKNQSFNIYEMYGAKVLEQIKEDPYMLYNDGFLGFTKCDELAIRNGMPSDSPERLTYGLLYVLNSIVDEGHTWIEKQELVHLTQKQLSLYGVSSELDTIVDLCVEKQLIVNNGERYSPIGVHNAEKVIASKILELAGKEIPLGNDIDRRINFAILESDVSLSEQQNDAIRGIPSQYISVLTGGAGVGKTTTVKVLLEVLLALNKKIVMAAPTGRAAQRLSEVTSHKVQTIHRLLGYNFEEKGFNHNEDNPLQGDFFIIDESSMIDVFLMSSLLKAIPKHSQILLIGDKNQLPSVGAGDVLNDIISSGKCKVFQLTQIFRQDENSKIVSFSYNVVEGVMPDIKSPLENIDLFDKKLDCLFIEADFLEEKDKTIFEKYKQAIVRNPYKYKYLGESSFERKHILDTRMLYEIEKKKFDKDEMNKRLACFNKFNAINFEMNPVDMIEQLYTTVIPKYYGEKMEIQILSPQKQTDIGTMILNKRIQDKINPASETKNEIVLDTITYREGDKVIQLKNNYEKGIFNGEIGYIVRVFPNEKKMMVDFSYGDNDKKVLIERDTLSDVDLAYAITIHKSQGSEFDCVIIPMSYLHKGMLFKNLIYTGMTRGKKLVIFVGQKQALNYGISNGYKISRNTNLKQLLMGK